jgi:hypothetical protein
VQNKNAQEMNAAIACVSVRCSQYYTDVNVGAVRGPRPRRLPATGASVYAVVVVINKLNGSPPVLLTGCGHHTTGHSDAKDLNGTYEGAPQSLPQQQQVWTTRALGWRHLNSLTGCPHPVTRHDRVVKDAHDSPSTGTMREGAIIKPGGAVYSARRHSSVTTPRHRGCTRPN